MAGGCEDERIGEGAWDGAIREAYLGDEPMPTPADRPASRFEVLGEERNGGRTSVIRARDCELDRDVSLEILVERVEAASEALGGFLAEAQVVAQLQHPGILPVLGLGFLEDGRPFVARRLAEGETLEGLVSRGGESRPRLLGIVEQAAHAVAYAHARGVAHGSLEASRVVRGAHGEVVVAGWERASRTNGDPGPVARDIAALDVMLETVAADGRAIVGKPSSASEIARAIGRHLGKAEAHARAAELTAAREKVRTEHERALQVRERRRAEAARWARRRTLAASAAVLLAVILGGAGLLWSRAEDRGAASRAEREFGAAMREAERHEAAGRWDEARAWALSAAAWGGSGPTARERAADMIGRIERRDLESRRDARLRARLRELRGMLYAGFPIDPVRLDVAYLEAFDEAGLDVDAEDATPTIARLRGMDRPGEIAAGLDDLMWVRRIEWPGSRHRKPRVHLVRIACAVDPDPWRVALRGVAGRDARRTQAATADAAKRSPEALNLLALALLEHGDAAAAHDLLREACRRNPGKIGLRVALTKDDVARSRGSYSGVQHATVAAALEPGEWGAWINLAHGLLLGRRGEEAVAAARRALDLRPDHAWSHDTLGAALVLRGDHERGLASIERALEIDPRLATAHVNRASVLLAQQKIGEAESAARLAVQWATVESEPFAILGRVLVRREDLDGAAAAFREAIRRGPVLGHAHCELARIRLLRRDPDEAIRLLEAGIALDPGHGCAFDRLGEAWRAKGDLPRAAEAWRAALRQGRATAANYHNLGVTLVQLGRFDEAVEPLRNAITRDPDDLEALRFLSYALTRRERRAEAADVYRRIVTRCPDDWIAHATLAHWLANCPDERLRRPREAVRLASRAVELAPGAWLPHAFLGLARLRAGMPKEALPAVRRGMELRGGGDANDWLILALVYGGLGDRENALAWYRRAVAWMAENETSDEELLRFRAEADAAFGEVKPTERDRR